jgi:hypothetical protein
VIGDVQKFMFLFLFIVPGVMFSLSFLDNWRELMLMPVPVPVPAVSAAAAAAAAATTSTVPLGGDFNPINLFAFMMGSTTYTLTQESDWLIMALMILFLIFGPVLALNLLIALMADTYSGVKEEAHAEWALKRVSMVLARERFCFWKSPHFSHYARLQEGEDNEKQDTKSPRWSKIRNYVGVKRSPFTYKLYSVPFRKFVPVKKADFPAKNHYMLKELYDNAKANAHGASGTRCRCCRYSYSC